ncbi:MAG: hypothetical protein AAGH76_18025, partial [Pseudomonadota bacterium]
CINAVVIGPGRPSHSFVRRRRQTLMWGRLSAAIEPRIALTLSSSGRDGPPTASFGVGAKP